MKKRVFSMLMASAFAICAGSFVSCEDSEDADKPNTLKVTPSSDITLQAGGNEDVVLTVETDAAEWSFEKSASWISATKAGNQLKVNAEANTTESVRPGRITIMAGNAEPVKINVVQNGLQAGEIVLSVTPAEAIEFEAKGNKPVELTVSTNAPDWTFTYPEAWMTAEKQDSKLVVNAKDNTGEANVGQIVVKTSEGDKSVRIAVSQKAADGGETPDKPSTDKIVGSLSIDDAVVKFAHDATDAVVKTVTFTLEKAADAEVQVELVYDEMHVEESNFDNNTEYEAFPENLYSLANNGILTVPAGETSATIEVTIPSPVNEIAYVTTYMLPLQAVAVTDNVTVSASAAYADLLVSKLSSKKIRNICYFEVNDCNPLNALEYVLEDGQQFFDAVVLFAGNINWNKEEQRVYVRPNPNVQALLDNSEELLQPLRRKGIKVLLDILGNHDKAGLANLTDYGCQEFGRELAQFCLDYKLDGVGFDDEYSNYYDPVPEGGADWFTSPSSYQAARLCYETKKAMTEMVPWETWVHLYYLGMIYSSMPSVTVDGVTYQPGEFIDNVCADYGGAAYPVAGMDKSGCAGTSIQLNSGYGLLWGPDRAKSIMDNGYGWIMWFAFDPSGTGTVANNRTRSLQQFRYMAEGCYEQTVLDPKNVYNKISEGEYDPEPHPIN